MSCPVAAIAVLAAASPSVAAEANLLAQMVGRTFVVPDGQAAPVPMTFSKPQEGVYEVRIGGELVETYRILSGRQGEQSHGGAPSLVSKAEFGPTFWSRTYKGLTVTFTLSAEGDLLGERSGEVEEWHARTYVYGHNPAHPDLKQRLAQALEEAHAEADRFEGHSHEH